MSRSTVVRFPLGDDPRDAVYTVRLTGSVLAQDYLCLQYLVFPVPPELVDDHAMHEGDHAGLTIHGSHVDRKCRSGYRTSANGNCVVGAVKIGPAAWPAFGRIAVLFAPFRPQPLPASHPVRGSPDRRGRPGAWRADPLTSMTVLVVVAGLAIRQQR